MDGNFLAARLSQLREQKGVSARTMSLDLGLSASYISNIENGKMLPSMQNFFYICEYLGISPSVFFDEGQRYPGTLHTLMDQLKKLDARQLDAVAAVAENMNRMI